ncbi:MAG: CocE/NonD family hydrolase [Alistipes sp.]
MRTFEEWPPADARKEVLYLRANGGLTTDRPSERESFSGYRSDPASPVPYDFPMRASRDKAYMVADQRFAAGRPDVLCFTTEPLAGDVTFAGGIRAVLQTAISTTDADFVVKLVDVWPDGSEHPDYQMLVRGDIMRGRYRRSFSVPEPFTPGEPTEVAFTMPDIAHTFRKGHRIMVQVQSTWFPLADRNPQQFVDIYRCAASDFIPCDVRIYHDRRRPSRLEVLRLR